MGGAAGDPDRHGLGDARVSLGARPDRLPARSTGTRRPIFQLTTPFDGWFGDLTSVMAGLYLIGFAAPAFEAAACHVGETIDPNRNVPRAMLASG